MKVKTSEKYCKHPDLPRARLIRIHLCFVKKWFWRGHTVRIANAREFFWLGINVVIRRPWLADPARVLHPELFN
ncbi:hypothetical protein [Pectobacterium brasiliense]|uniref:hypothetical protein n=1 Tax=Pectobacterium brasiliense TaxID=180957 RepID=UPI0011B0DD5F|nr:hypothetical protein [Pectobacterium brasiliense]